jgi:hypothetical protein
MESVPLFRWALVLLKGLLITKQTNRLYNRKTPHAILLFFPLRINKRGAGTCLLKLKGHGAERKDGTVPLVMAGLDRRDDSPF